MTGPFGLHAERLASYGYEPIPISLPTDGGDCSGKRPAQKEGWQNGCPRDHWPAYARYGIGILTRSTPAVDIDVLNQPFAETIQRLAERVLGDSPYRIGLPPKRLLPYRLAGEPFPKLKVTWRGLADELHTNPKKPPAVEFLSEGQQFVAFGEHPITGQPYVWHRDPDLEIPHGLLPAVNRATAERFMRAIAGALERQGATDIKLTGVDRPAAQPTPLPRPVANGEHPAAGFMAKHGIKPAGRATDAERIADALGKLPVPDDYDSWIRIGLALNKNLPGSEGERLWHWFSSRSTKYDQREAARKWASFKPGRITAGTIVWEARR